MRSDISSTLHIALFTVSLIFPLHSPDLHLHLHLPCGLVWGEVPLCASANVEVVTLADNNPLTIHTGARTTTDIIPRPTKEDNKKRHDNSNHTAHTTDTNNTTGKHTCTTNVCSSKKNKVELTSRQTRSLLV